MWSPEDDVVLSAATYYMENKINSKLSSLLSPKPSLDPPQFELADDDSLSKNCGKIFITINRLLVFHCTICNMKYGTLYNFLQHVSAKHYLHGQIESEKSTIKPKEIDAEESPNTALEPIQFLPLEVDNNSMLKRKRSSSKPKAKKKPVVKKNTASKSDIKVEELDKLEKMKIAEKESGDFENDVGLQDEVSVSSLEDLKPTKDSTSSHITFAYKHKCDKCDKVFTRKISLKNHALTHLNVKNYKCTFCDAAFTLKCNLNKHLLRHAKEKKYICELCDRRFFSITEATVHQRSHTGERPYVCFQCGKGFKYCSNLTDHIKRHNNIRTKKCDVCEKCFFDKKELMSHMAGHSSERPFLCTYCSASFARRKTLKQHIKLHINAREYECNLCDKSFNQKPALLSHINNNHKSFQRVGT